jgi:polysaccharide biosynthesis/export protein
MRRISNSICHVLVLLSIGLFLTQNLRSQMIDDEQANNKRVSPSKSIDFSKIFETEKTTIDQFEALKTKKQQKIRERLSQPTGIEKAVNPDQYHVGPGDVLSFNVWGALEEQFLLTVNPEGKLLLPSVGEVMVSGRTLADVQREVVEKAKPFYNKSVITLSLESIRFFRVHVVGEVAFPGTYVVQALTRVSEMITEAGGVSDWAWKSDIELRHVSGKVDTFDLDLFEQAGGESQDLFVDGGDVVFIPPIQQAKNFVTVEGDVEASGIYPLRKDETLFGFLQRIKALRRNIDMSKIVIVRKNPNSSDEKSRNALVSSYPFSKADSLNHQMLQPNDIIIIPSRYVYIKGAVKNPGAYLFQLNLKAKDYIGMAGGDQKSGDIENIMVQHIFTGKKEKGPNTIVDPGDFVTLHPTWNERFGNFIQILPAITSLFLAATAAGLFKN